MTAVFASYRQPTLWDMTGSDSSPASAAGRKPAASPAGPPTSPSGTAPAPARPSRRRARSSAAPSAEAVLCRALDALASSYASSASTPGTPTPVTFGRSSGGSSPSADLQSSLASRLVARMDSYGSPEFVLRWKSLDTALGPPILRRAASAPRTSASASSGSPSATTSGPPGLATRPTPVANPANGEPEDFLRRKRESIERGHSMGVCLTDLQMVAKLAGFPTPNQRDAKVGSLQSYRERGGGAKGKSLSNLVQSQLAGWGSPRSTEIGTCRSPEAIARAKERGGSVSLEDQVHLAGWHTPHCPRENDSQHSNTSYLGRQAEQMASWPTPMAGSPGAGNTDYSRRVVELASGMPTPYSPSGTASRGALNPELSRWLMGFPPAWSSCADTAMQSFPRSRRSSSRRSSTSSACRPPKSP